MANGALDSYLQVQLNVFDIPNILLENGWVDNKIQTISKISQLKKKWKFSDCVDNFVWGLLARKIAVDMETLQILKND